MTLSEFCLRQQFNTDKSAAYLELYDNIFSELGKNIRLLEFGVFNCGSLKLFAEYMPAAQIYGYDQALPHGIELPANVHLATGDQANSAELSSACDTWNCHLFDVIIDDASHLGNLSAATFAEMFDRRLRPGGKYVLEDWGVSYWNDWPDGEFREDAVGKLYALRKVKYPPYNKSKSEHVIASNTAGMAGLVKLLIDVLAQPHEASKLGLPDSTTRIDKIEIHPGIVIITKSST